MHVFISPHLDDAVLSCGGLINQLVQRGEKVVSITVMAGSPNEPLPDTPLTRDLHQRWQAGKDPYETRRQEDFEALHRLGVQNIQHLGLLDCPYRTNVHGKPLYTLNSHLFSGIHPDDPVLAYQLPIPQNAHFVYAPLGAGGHVDHLAVRRAAQQLPSDLVVYYYEEYPYSASSGEARRITDDSPQQQVGAQAVQTALDSFQQRLRPRLTFLTEDDLAAKIAAIMYYRSQISSFWDNTADMAARVRAYAQEVAAPAAERLWVKGESNP